MNGLKKRNKYRRFLPFYIMMLPTVIYFIINNYIPMLGLQLAFKNYKVPLGIWGSEWIGFKNFEFLFKTKDAWLITRNTIGYNFVFIAAGTLFSLLVSIMLAEVVGKAAKKFYQTVILLPYLISMVVVAYLVNALLSTDTGFINNSILAPLGIEGINWYNEPKYWPFILVIVYIWKSFGYSTIIYMATLLGIDRGYYEAATIDGASRWHQIKYISLPLLKPTIITLTLLSIGKIFYSDFGLFYQVPMESGPLYAVTNTIDTYVYRGLMLMGNIGMSAASGFYQSMVGFVLILVTNYSVRKISRENALF